MACDALDVDAIGHCRYSRRLLVKTAKRRKQSKKQPDKIGSLSVIGDTGFGRRSWGKERKRRYDAKIWIGMLEGRVSIEVSIDRKGHMPLTREEEDNKRWK